MACVASGLPAPSSVVNALQEQRFRYGVEIEELAFDKHAARHLVAVAPRA
jgi:peroxiredoxin